MDRWYLRMNVSLLKKALAEEADGRLRRIIEGQIVAAERDLALFEANLNGVLANTTRRPFNLNRDRRDARLISQIRREFDASAEPLMMIDPRPGLHIVDSNDAHAAATMTDRSQIAGGRLFEVFPENPQGPQREGVKKTYDSLNLAAHGPNGHTMEAQRYDIRDSEGQFVERYWRIVNTPLHDSSGRLLYLLAQVKDVTAQHVRGAIG